QVVPKGFARCGGVSVRREPNVASLERRAGTGEHIDPVRPLSGLLERLVLLLEGVGRRLPRPEGEPRMGSELLVPVSSREGEPEFAKIHALGITLRQIDHCLVGHIQWTSSMCDHPRNTTDGASVKSIHGALISSPSMGARAGAGAPRPS